MKSEDKHLTWLLKSCSNDDLDPIVGYILNVNTNELDWQEAYKENKPNHLAYVDEIVYEIKTFGGNTLKNILRGDGPSYGEIAWDVCSRLGANPEKGDSVEELELKAIAKLAGDALEKADPKERAALEEELRKSGWKGADFSAGKPLGVVLAQASIKMGGFAAYRLAAVVANAVAKFILGRGLSFAGNALLMRLISVFAGPLGWAVSSLWTLVDLAGPAYRVTIPCVLHVGYLRQKKKHCARTDENESGGCDTPSSAPDPAEDERRISEEFDSKMATIGDDNPVVALAKKAREIMLSDSVAAADKLLIVGALLYFLAPLDAVPDFIPMFGYADDVTVLGLSIQRAWKALCLAKIGLKGVQIIGREFAAAAADAASEKVDQMLDQGISKSFAAAATGVWAATTTIAMGVLYRAHMEAAGGPVAPDPYKLFCVVSAIFIVAVNLVSAARVVEVYRAIPPPWDRRIINAICVKIRWWYVLITIGPILALSVSVLFR